MSMPAKRALAERAPRQSGNGMVVGVVCVPVSTRSFTRRPGDVDSGGLDVWLHSVSEW
jgi:hypothetical protein